MADKKLGPSIDHLIQHLPKIDPRLHEALKILQSRIEKLEKA